MVDQRLQHRFVGGIGAVVEFAIERFAQCIVFGVAHEGDVIGVVRCDPNLAVIVGCPGRDPVVRQPGQRRGRIHCDAAHVFGDIAIELDAGGFDPSLEFHDSLADGLVTVDTGQAEIPQRLFDEELCLGVFVRHVDARESLVDRT